MQSRRDGKPARLPTLIPLHGNFDKKPRTLDRDVTLIGRARGSDLCLDASDVSTLHCIIFRTSEGYRVRDCNSRTGTRVNGAAVRGSPLHDADVLNIGPFSFEVKIPHGLSDHGGPPPDLLKIAHWQASRRRFAEHALALRRRLSQRPENGDDGDLQRKAQGLREQIRAYDQRAGQLEEAERELTGERAALRQEQEAHRERVVRIEKELAGRLAEVEAQIHARWLEFQQHCQAAEEARLVNEARKLQQSPASDDPQERDQLARLTADFQEQQQRLSQGEQQLALKTESYQRQCQELTSMKQQLDLDQAETSAALEQQRAALAHQEAQLRAQRTELTRMMGDLRKMQDDLRKQQKGDTKAIIDENQQLKNLVAEYEERLSALTLRADRGADGDREIGDLRAENDLLREMLQEKQEQSNTPGVATAEVDELRKFSDQLQAENEVLKQLIEVKNSLVEELSQQATAAPKPGKNASELEKYETELNQFGQQLEGDRAKLAREIEALRSRNEELDEAMREMEMQMSRERAEMARERIRMDRLREELKCDMEKLQRETAVRGSLSSVNKLRAELHPKKSG